MTEQGIFIQDRANQEGFKIQNPNIAIGNVEGYSSKLGKRLRSCFDGCQLKLVGGQFDGKTAKSIQIMPSLPVYPLDQMDDLKAAEFNASLPKVYEKLLFVNDPISFRDSYIDGLGGNDMHDIHSLAQDVANREKPKIVIRIVMGATGTMPLRSLSYVIPGLVMAENLKSIGLNPQVQIINALHISSSLSNVDLETAKKQAELFTSVSEEYISKFFPQTERNVVFLKDKPIDDELHTQIQVIEEVVKKQSSANSKTTLCVKGQNHDAQDNSYLYASAHVLMHDMKAEDILSHTHPDQPQIMDPSVIISIGGKQEGLFYQIRHEVKPFISNNEGTRTIQYFTSHHVPPYYVDRNGDVSLSSALSRSKYELEDLIEIVRNVPSEISPVGRSAKYDLSYLHNITDKRGDLFDFLERTGRRLNHHE